MCIRDRVADTDRAVGMYFMARKRVEHWWLWIIGDAISVPLYFYKGLGITAFQYIVFLYLAIMGLREWNATISDRDLH